MTVKDTTLIKAAWMARQRAYAPYSKFQVGAAIETADGQIFTGCNVENASYGGTVCAERVAILKAVSEGALSPGSLVRVAVATKTSKPVTPCGFCRQIIEEFAGPETAIIISNETGKVAAQYLQRELLPASFNNRDLDAAL